MADWDSTNPGDSDIVSQYPANERAAREAVRDNFGVDHHEADDSDVGKHEVIQVMDNAADPTVDAGDVGVWNNGGTLNTRAGGGAVHRMIQLPAGTKMLFYQASAPPGWTQDTTANDRVLRVVDSAGAGTGGSWTISGVTVDNHTLTTAEMPSHDHGMGNAGSHNHSGTNSAGNHGHSMGSAGGHQHAAGVLFTGLSANEELTMAPYGSTGISFGSTVRFLNDVDSSLNVTTAPSGRAQLTQSAGGHTHSINSNGAHTHSINSDGGHTHSVGDRGGSGAHNHGLTADGSWRPSYVDVIAANLD